MLLFMPGTQVYYVAGADLIRGSRSVDFKIR
jgi:hypothetical protein